MRAAAEIGDIRAFFRENLALSTATYGATRNATLSAITSHPLCGSGRGSAAQHS